MNDAKQTPDSNAQHDRFIETARELGCDEDEAAFLRKLGKLVRVKPTDTEPPKDGN